MSTPQSLATRPARGPWRLAVFDLDGTLVDTRTDLVEALDDAWAPGSLDAAARARANAALHLGMYGMVEAALTDTASPVDVERINQFYERYLKAYSARIARHSRPYRGVTAALQWLEDRGIPMAVCSNKAEAMSRQLLQELDLIRWFPVIVGPGSTGWAKPHPEPLYHAAFQSGVARSRTVLIGDSSVDMRCAQAAGIDSWIYSGGYDAEAAARASFVFDRFEQLCDPSYWITSRVPHQRTLS